MKIATYRTRAGAERYAADLRKASPGKIFRVTPWGFGFGVVNDDGDKHAMVVACPRKRLASMTTLPYFDRIAKENREVFGR